MIEDFFAGITRIKNKDNEKGIVLTYSPLSYEVAWLPTDNTKKNVIRYDHYKDLKIIKKFMI